MHGVSIPTAAEAYNIPEPSLRSRCNRRTPMKQSNYTDDDIASALEDIRSGVSRNQASVTNNIPYNTLTHWISNKTQYFPIFRRNLHPISRESNAKSHACPGQGGKTFPTKAKARRHARFVHTNRVLCPSGCGKSFGNPSSAMEQFNYIHSGIKIACPEGCGEVFTSRGRFKYRLKVFHSRKRYPCPNACGKDFASKRYSRLHAEKVHQSMRIVNQNKL